MDQINFRAILLPSERADAQTYWLGLGLIALFDTVRLTLISPGLAQSVLITLILLTTLHINRLRDAGRSSGFIALPLLLGMAGKVIVACIALFVAMLPVLAGYLEQQGVDLEDSEALNRISVDPQFQADLQAYIVGNEAIAIQLVDAMAWPSHWGFWIVVALLARWFARLPGQR